MQKQFGFLTALNKINESACKIVADSPASFFSKNDVANIIGNVIQEMKEYYSAPDEIASGFSREDIQEVVRFAFEEMHYSHYYRTDNDTAQFDLSYDNKIELTEVDVDFNDTDFLTALNKNILDGLDALEEQSKTNQ